LGKRALVCSEEFLSASDILDVSDDAGLSVGGQHFEEALLPLDFFEDDQTLPSLTLVVGLLLVLAEEEQSTVGKRNVVSTGAAGTSQK